MSGVGTYWETACKRPSQAARAIAATGFSGLLFLLAFPESHAQTTTAYSYNSSNRIIQAISSTGSGVQYQYDAAGNTVSVGAVGAEALVSGTTDTLTFATPGEAALLSFTLASPQNVTLSDSSLSLSGNGASLMFNVYNSVGSLVGSYDSATSSELILNDLASGTYSIIVVPTSGTTGSVQLSLNTSGAATGGGDADAPIPLWVNLLLGSALLGLGGKAVRRRSAP